MDGLKRLFTGSLTWNLVLTALAVVALLIGGIYTLTAGGILIKMATAIAAVVTLMLGVRIIMLISSLDVRYESILNKIKADPQSAAIFFGALFLTLGLVVGPAFGQPSPAAWPEPDPAEVRAVYAEPEPLAASWPARFTQCEPYRDEIENAVQTYWGSFAHPEAWAAQLYQESLCDPWAQSPVGAAGLAQFMPATWVEVSERFGLQASPHDDIAIEMGAYYMARQMGIWRSPRPQIERWRLGLASYNAGAGNIINAQRKCDGARDWRDIRLCLPGVTGHHSAETMTYVERTERWWRELGAAEPLSGAPGPSVS